MAKRPPLPKNIHKIKKERKKNDDIEEGKTVKKMNGVKIAYA